MSHDKRAHDFFKHLLSLRRGLSVDKVGCDVIEISSDKWWVFVSFFECLPDMIAVDVNLLEGNGSSSVTRFTTKTVSYPTGDNASAELACRVFEIVNEEMSA